MKKLVLFAAILLPLQFAMAGVGGGGGGTGTIASTTTVLKGDGAGNAVATTTSDAFGYILSGGINTNVSLADASTYYVGALGGVNLNAHSYSNNAFVIPKSGTIKRIIWLEINQTSNGTNESVAHYLRLNDTTDTTLSTSETYDQAASATKVFNYTVSIAVSAGDRVALKIVTPTWATNPTGSQGSLFIYIE